MNLGQMLAQIKERDEQAELRKVIRELRQANAELRQARTEYEARFGKKES